MILHSDDIDVMCKIIDNYGDAGFSFRFARVLKQHTPTRRVRLFIDELTTLKAIAPELDQSASSQTIAGIEVICYPNQRAEQTRELEFAPLIIESLACEIPENLRKQIYAQSQLIITLEHLTAEKSFESLHGLSSPTGFDIPRYLFSQGFTGNSGGMLIEDDILELITKHENQSVWRKKWLALFIEYLPQNAINFKMGSLFSYNRNMKNLVDYLHSKNEDHLIFVLGNLSQNSIKQDLAERKVLWLQENIAQVGQVFFLFPKMLAFKDYDSFLFAMDYNMVRGEDSLARAILAGKPFLWHSYPQENDYQLTKVTALLDVMEHYADFLPDFEKYRKLMLRYNSNPILELNEKINDDENYYSLFDDFVKIQSWVNRFREDLINQGGLITKLERFIKFL